MYGIICKLSIQFYDRGSYREGLKLTVKLNGISVVRLEFVYYFYICVLFSAENLNIQTQINLCLFLSF